MTELIEKQNEEQSINFIMEMFVQTLYVISLEASGTINEHTTIVVIRMAGEIFRPTVRKIFVYHFKCACKLRAYNKNACVFYPLVWKMF